MRAHLLRPLPARGASCAALALCAVGMLLAFVPLASAQYPPSSRRVAAVSQPLPPPTMPEAVPNGRPVPPPASCHLTLQDFEQIALANNPTIVQAEAQVRAAQGQRWQAGLRPNPIVGYQGSEVGQQGTAGQQGAFISQEFVRRRKLELARAAGSGAVAQAQFEFAAQRMRVINDIRAEYFNVLVAQRAMELTQGLVNIGQQAVDASRRLFEGQQIAYVEVLQSHIEFDTAGITQVNARNRHSAAWRKLAAVAGVPEMQPQRLEGDLHPHPDDLTWEPTLARLLAESPELANARAGVTRSRARLERERVDPRPNVDVQFGVQYDNSSQSTISNLQIGVPVPVLNANQGNIQTAFADLRSAQAEVGRVELSLRTRLAAAFEAYANARNQVEKYTDDILPDARNVLDLIAKGYEQQQFSYLTLLTAQRTFNQANLAYLQALQQMGASRVAIEGLLLNGSLRKEDTLDVPVISTTIAPVFGPGRPPVQRD